MTKLAVCRRCDYHGNVTCPRCKGYAGCPSGKIISNWEKLYDKCGMCWGTGSILCECGGSKQRPPKGHRMDVR